MAGRPRLTDENFDPSKMGVNPFLKQLSIGVLETTSKQPMLAVDENEEIVTGIKGRALLESRYYSEVQHFTKVFHSPKHRKAIGELPARAKALLIWLVLELKNSKDYIIINISRYKKENKISHNTYLRSVEDLVNANIMMPTVHSTVFWINPSLMFNGSRIKTFEDHLSIFEKKNGDKNAKPYKVTSILE